MEHKGTEILQTGRLVLRPFQIDDAEQMFRNWASDKTVTKFLTWPAHENMDVTRNTVQGWVDGYAKPDQYLWAVEFKELHEPIGSIAAVKIDAQTESASIGYCIGRKWWGQGLVAEALRAVIRFFFEEVGMNCVNACHDPRNPNSGKVMRKSGMTYEGTWRAAGRNNLGICDESWYSILKSEYACKDAPDDMWDEMYRRASAVQNDRNVSEYIEAGGVAAAVLSASGKIYTGVCVDTCATLGICAERNAIFNMLTNGEQEIKKVLAIMPDGHTGAPCGACREFMVQLMPENYKEIEILLDYEKKRVVTLGELTPEWWI